MTWEKVFLSQGEVRPIWRCLLSLAMIVLAYVFVGILLGVVLGATGLSPERLTVLFWVNFLMLPVLLGIFQLLVGAFDRRPLGSVGLAFFPRWLRELGAGLGLGAAMMLIVAALEMLLRLARFQASAAAPPQLLGGGLLIGVGLLVAAANEELIFRGYPFQRLVDSIGPVPAVVLSSVLFGVVHLGNPSHTWLSTLNTMIVGIPLAIAYLRTRALWMPIGIHFAWNFLQGYGLGLPVSGVVLPTALFQSRVSGASWLTGAAYGPEAGVLTTGVMAAAALYLAWAPHLRVSGAMKALLRSSPASNASAPGEKPPPGSGPPSEAL